MMSAFKYFLKGNMLFALNGTVLTACQAEHYLVNIVSMANARKRKVRHGKTAVPLSRFVTAP